MDGVRILAQGTIGRSFIGADYLPANADQDYLRNQQAKPPRGGWRPLRSDEVAHLVKNNNYADDWDAIFVSNPFDPDQIKNNRFYGTVRIGSVHNAVLDYHELQLPIGITNSMVISTDIGDDCAIHDVSYLSHYIVGERCILFNIDEMNCTDHAKFGNGIVKVGEPESVRVWLDLMNETGSRGVLPFDGLTSGDAYLWAKYRDDAALQRACLQLTQRAFDARRGYYGTVGDQAVIKNSRILKDVKVGDFAYIKGANKLKNLTINSSAQEPSQIGEGVELVNGIVGYGCRIFYGCKAVRFVLGNNSSLKYGARLINSYLGDNSTISCCEVLNNLIFPAHEQHHNNSFLVAAVVMGQSNIAAGATIGSNHNSRANDNEIQAGRGFWPGLCTSLKHSSRFASFVLLAKADYPAELDIPFPFALVSNKPATDRIEVLPAFWWLHNMYALARNSWKFRARDKRVQKIQHIEFDYLAPDTVEEIFHALDLMAEWTAQAAIAENHPALPALAANRQSTAPPTSAALRDIGIALLSAPNADPTLDELTVLGQNMEKSDRLVRIVRPLRSFRAYRQMIHHYALTQILDHLDAEPDASSATIANDLAGPAPREWVNLGGQLVAAADLDRLRQEIGDGTLSSWNAVHQRYDELWARYPRMKRAHAFAALQRLYRVTTFSPVDWQAHLQTAAEIQRYIAAQVLRTRQKDYENPFRQITFRNEAEMRATIGTIEENEFVRLVRQQTDTELQRLDAAERRLAPRRVE